MMERITETSPRFKATIAGGLWLMVIVAGMSAFVIRSPLIVRGDAAATATNILASESLYRFGFAADLIAGACYMGVTGYQLLRDLSVTCVRSPPVSFHCARRPFGRKDR